MASVEQQYNSAGMPRCNCCSYGYHIDRDFVEFAESYRSPSADSSRYNSMDTLSIPVHMQNGKETWEQDEVFRQQQHHQSSMQTSNHHTTNFQQNEVYNQQHHEQHSMLQTGNKPSSDGYPQKIPINGEVHVMTEDEKDLEYSRIEKLIQTCFDGRDPTEFDYDWTRGYQAIASNTRVIKESREDQEVETHIITTTYEYPEEAKEFNSVATETDPEVEANIRVTEYKIQEESVFPTRYVSLTNLEPLVNVATKGTGTEYSQRHAGTQAIFDYVESEEELRARIAREGEIEMSSYEHGYSVGMSTAERERPVPPETKVKAVSCEPIVHPTGFGDLDVTQWPYVDAELADSSFGETNVWLPPYMAVPRCDAWFGRNDVTKRPYIDPELRNSGVGDADIWADVKSVKKTANQGTFTEVAKKDYGGMADLLPKPPQRRDGVTQHDRRRGLVDTGCGETVRTQVAAVQHQTENRPISTGNPWDDLRPRVADFHQQAEFDPQIIETETETINVASSGYGNKFEAILKAIYKNKTLNKDEVTKWVHEALRKDVRTQESQCEEGWSPRQFLHSGVQTSAEPRVEQRHHSVQCKPKSLDSQTATDRISAYSVSSNTEMWPQTHKSVMTTAVLNYPANTQTDAPQNRVGVTGTDMKIFLATEQLKNVGTNTTGDLSEQDKARSKETFREQIQIIPDHAVSVVEPQSPKQVKPSIASALKLALNQPQDQPRNDDDFSLESPVASPTPMDRRQERQSVVVKPRAHADLHAKPSDVERPLVDERISGPRRGSGFDVAPSPRPQIDSEDEDELSPMDSRPTSPFPRPPSRTFTPEPIEGAKPGTVTEMARIGLRGRATPSPTPDTGSISDGLVADRMKRISSPDMRMVEEIDRKRMDFLQRLEERKRKEELSLDAQVERKIGIFNRLSVDSPAPPTYNSAGQMYGDEYTKSHHSVSVLATKPAGIQHSFLDSPVRHISTKQENVSTSGTKFWRPPASPTPGELQGNKDPAALKGILKKSQSEGGLNARHSAKATFDLGHHGKSITFSEEVLTESLSDPDSDQTTDSDSEQGEASLTSTGALKSWKQTGREEFQDDSPDSLESSQIRETFELTEELRESCELYSAHLENETTVPAEALARAEASISEAWFRVGGDLLANSHEIEDFLNSANEFSSLLLQRVVNFVDSNGNTALHYAVSHNNFSIINLMLDTGKVDVDIQNRAGYSALMLASLATATSTEHRDILQRLFKEGSVNSRAAQYAQDHAGQTALMLAVSHGRVDMVEMLLICGADVNAQDDEGSTALMVACEHGFLDIVKVLLASGECDTSLTDNDNSTALSIALEGKQKDIALLLYGHQNFSKSGKKSSAQESITSARHATTSSSYSASSRTIR